MGGNQTPPPVKPLGRTWGHEGMWMAQYHSEDQVLPWWIWTVWTRGFGPVSSSSDVPSATAGTTFCAGVSLFAILFLSTWGLLIKSGYPYVGEWAHQASGEPLEEQRALTSGAVFSAVGIYAGFFALSFLGE